MTFENVQLSEVADIIVGFPFKSELFNTSQNGIRLVRGKNITRRALRWGDDSRWWSDLTIDLNKYYLKENDIVIGMDGSLVGKNFAKIAKKDLPLLLVQRVACVRAKENISQEFLWQNIATSKFENYIESVKTGTTIPHISAKQIGEYEIPLFDIKSQNIIAGILSNLDKKNSINTAINENLEQQAQAIFKSWFVDFEPFGGVMPDDWHECELDSICSLIIKGITPKYVEQSDQLVINQKCVRNHQIDLAFARCHVPKKINEKWLRYGDIIVNSTGTGTLGRAAQVLFDPSDLTVDSHVTIIRAAKHVYQLYLGFWATSHEHDFEALETGSTGQTDLPRERLKQMQIILPSDDVLNSFTQLVKPICDIKMKNQHENERLATLRDTLLPKLMNGEIDVSAVKI